jgi:hypothetical protein
MSSVVMRARKAGSDTPPSRSSAAATSTLPTGKNTNSAMEATMSQMDETTKTSPRMVPRRASPVVRRNSRAVPATNAP